MWSSLGWWCVFHSARSVDLSQWYKTKLLAYYFSTSSIRTGQNQYFVFSLKIVFNFLTTYIKIAMEDFN